MAKKSVRQRGKLSKTTRSEIRQSKREDMPSSAFLVPSEKKYPVKRRNKETGTWEYDANLILAAERRARLNNDTSVESKAVALRKKHVKQKTQ